MGLEEILRERNKIVLLESLTVDSSKVSEEARELEQELGYIFDKQYSVDIRQIEIKHNPFFEARLKDRTIKDLDVGADSLVVINSHLEVDSKGAGNIISAKKLYDKIRKEYPEAKCLVLGNYIYGGFAANSAVAQALDLIIRTMTDSTDNKEFLDSLIGVEHGLFTKWTLFDYLKSQLGGIRHKIGNERNEAFIRELSERFMDGNSQTKTDKTFLIVSNRFDGIKGKFDVVAPNSKFEDIHFSRYAAIFVDNNYNFKDGGNASKLGNGIYILEELSKLNIGLPVIYQTAHRLEDFSEEEIKKITRFENVILMPKNRGFKITTVVKAKKEIAIDEIISQDKILSQHCIKTHRIGRNGYIENGDYAIVPTESVQAEKEKKFSDAFVEYSYRLGVLAAFHTRMRSEIDNPLFNSSVTYFRMWGDIKKGICKKISDDKGIGQLYGGLVKKHSRARPTTVIHNDAKWDNWFGGYVLGDFGDACPGTEYKDIARALLDKETDFKLVRDDRFVERCVNEYIKLREKYDVKFKLVKNFCRNVRELIFIESLRLARSKAQMIGNDKIIDGLLDVARHYKTGLLNSDLSASYNNMPSNGETAPYISRDISI